MRSTYVLFSLTRGYTDVTQVELFRIQLPKIGTVIGINPDDTYQQGPVPELCGHFDTATDFFKAWATYASFGMSPSSLTDASDSYANEVETSTASFEPLINDLATRLSVRNEGPFPPCHGNFGHNNIIFDDE